MKHSTDFMEAMADLDINPEAVLWRAGSPIDIRRHGKAIKIILPFSPFRLNAGLTPAEDFQPETLDFYIEFYKGGILRMTNSTAVGTGLPDSPMLEPALDLLQEQLDVTEKNDSWDIRGTDGGLRAIFSKAGGTTSGWSDLIRPSFDSLAGVLFPDSSAVTFSSYDQFFPEKVESLPLAFIETEDENGKRRSSLFSFQAGHDEHFCGTGERFSRMDLAGGTYTLENTDVLGNNSRRAYKNVPFYLSSRRYGLFIHTSSHLRLSLADISTRAAQGRIEEGDIDLFIIDAETPERILHNYRRLTGFPPELPMWSYGMWMSRMTYFSADEIEGITERLRDEEYPCDVIHIDTGWFRKDWVCEWEFSPERFPEPEEFINRLRTDGFRVSLWQTPNIGEGNSLLEEALRNRYLAPPKTESVSTASDFSGQDFGGQIDFTNPDAVEWYKKKIKRLLDAGVSVIKTDFGEKIQFDADYLNMDATALHNIYGMLYQKAAYEQTLESTGEGIIWARAGWAGAQRYPLHWGGDTACSWDGMAAVLRGGLHLGLSGFGFWSHDVPGFHGLPEFMNSMPDNKLYIRWTQFAVFSSHFRYHGTSPREPWYYPEIAPMIRKWLNLRYALIPYLACEAEKSIASGMPMLRAMLLCYPGDPICWHIDDQFFCGESILVCPVMNGRGIRNIYLPEGKWVDFWNGERFTGGKWLMNVESPLNRCPVFIADETVIPLYPEAVQSTEDMVSDKTVHIVINENFNGIKRYYTSPELLP